MSTSELTAFGPLLRRSRMTAQMTQKQLGERVGLSPSSIAAMERGLRRPPSPATVELLAGALGLSDSERANLNAAAQSLSAVPAADAKTHPDSTRPEETRWRNIRWIPIQPTPLVGRSQELEAILRMLTVEGVRLLTLVGPAGVGKTRLALAAAAGDQLAGRFLDGITLVDLAPIRAPQDVLAAIGRACGFTDTGQLSPGERLRTFLQDRETLLVLDNFEQALPAAASLAELLAACPSLALLVTSRAPACKQRGHSLRPARYGYSSLGVDWPRSTSAKARPMPAVSTTRLLRSPSRARTGCTKSGQATAGMGKCVSRGWSSATSGNVSAR
jgi:transcriptional regulator with XRE-family HTH domain